MWINGLSLDYANNKLYWCDAYTDRIEVIELLTMKRVIIFFLMIFICKRYCCLMLNFFCINSQLYLTSFLQTKLLSQGVVRHPYGLVHMNTPDKPLTLFWTEFVDGHIKHVSINLEDNSTEPAADTIRSESQPLFEIRLYDKDIQVCHISC